MSRIYPINEEMCSRFIGAPVCAVLHDGTEHYGVISRIEGGKLILNDSPETAEASGAGRRAKGKAGTSAKGKGKADPGAKAQVSAYPASFGFPHPFGGRIALELAAIAFLFLLFI